MDHFKQFKHYVKIILESNIDELKVLLVDDYTKKMLALVTSVTELMNYNIFLIDHIKNEEQREKIKHAHCIIFIKPINTSIKYLLNELERQSYHGYSLFFTNFVKQSDLRDIASSDVDECVESVKEVFLDYYIMDKYMSVIPNVLKVDEVLSLILTTARCAPYVLCQSESKRCLRMAEQVYNSLRYNQTIQQDVLKGKKKRNAILLVLDRWNDPVTPLLQQWTYQAMIQELLNVKDNVVTCRKGEDNEKEIVLSYSDDFYVKNMHKNWGDICLEIKKELQKLEKNEKIESIEDMRNFVVNYSQYKSSSRKVENHIDIITELKKIIRSTNLMELSIMEQELVCCDDYDSTKVISKLGKLILKGKNYYPRKYIINLMLLFHLRFGRKESYKKQRKQLYVICQKNYDFSKEEFELIDRMQLNPDLKNGELFVKKGLKGFFERIKAVTGLKDVKNVFIQHKPIIHKIINNFFQYNYKPYIIVGEDAKKLNKKKSHVKTLIIFVVGGVTYEENKIVQMFNEKNEGSKSVFLCGTQLLTSEKFKNKVYNQLI